MMRRWFSPYWFNDVSISFLIFGAALLAAGILFWYSPARPQLAPLFYLGAGLCGLVAGYYIVRRRHAVGRFYNVFGFMPHLPGEETFQHLVVKKILDRARLLQECYTVRDRARSAMREANDPQQARERQQAFRRASDDAAFHKSWFYRTVDAARSPWLPARHKDISGNYLDWENQLRV